jgi:hypothetical protein
MQVFSQCCFRRFVIWLMTVFTSVLFGERAGRRMADRREARDMIDVYRRKAALVVMRVPERQLLAAMRRTERVVDVEDLHPARLHGRAELIEQSHAEPCCIGLARRILPDCSTAAAPRRIGSARSSFSAPIRRQHAVKGDRAFAHRGGAGARAVFVRGDRARGASHRLWRSQAHARAFGQPPQSLRRAARGE